MSKLLVLSSNQELIKQLDNHSPACLTKLRAIKKWIRTNTSGVILIDCRDLDQDIATQIVGYCRQSTNNQVIAIWGVVQNSDSKFDNLDIFDRTISISSDHIQASDIPIEELNKELHRQACIESQNREFLSQLELFSTINRFNIRGLSVTQSLTEFIQVLDRFCGAKKTLLFRHINNPQQETKCFKLDENNHTDLTSLEKDSPYWNLKERLSESKQPNIVFSNAEFPDSMLFFPIVVLESIACVVVCIIDEESMDKLSIKNVKVFEEAAIQLKINLENIESQRRTKHHYQRLKGTLTELQIAKDKIVHTEKMATLGQLAAGIAHEINNPLGIAISNIDPLEQYFGSVVSVLEMHDRLMAQVDNSETEEYSKKINDYNLEEVKSDLSELLSESRSGLIRVKNIVADLSTFASNDEAKLDECLIYEVVDEVLKMNRYQSKNEVGVNNTIAKSMRLKSNKRLFHQLMNNLLVNAIEAADAIGEDGVVRIGFDSDSHSIYVSDNGSGILDEHKNKVFDPFFTTKSLNKGVGMGLTVANNIANELGFNLAIKETSPSGTTFAVGIPEPALLAQ